MGGLAVLILLGLVSVPHTHTCSQINKPIFILAWYSLNSILNSHFLFEPREKSYWKKFGSIKMRWRADLIQIISVIWTFDVKLLIESLCPWHLCVRVCVVRAHSCACRSVCLSLEPIYFYPSTLNECINVWASVVVVVAVLFHSTHKVFQ